MPVFVHPSKSSKSGSKRRRVATPRGPFAESQEMSVLFALSVLGLPAHLTTRQFARQATTVFPRLAEQTNATAGLR